MSALNARRWRVRGQMVATGDSARRCARVDGVYSTPGVDGVYSTTVRVDDARAARLSHRWPALRRVPGRQPCGARRRVFSLQRSLACNESFFRGRALWVWAAMAAVARAAKYIFSEALGPVTH